LPLLPNDGGYFSKESWLIGCPLDFVVVVQYR
jgi:hypothetical protein